MAVSKESGKLSSANSRPPSTRLFVSPFVAGSGIVVSFLLGFFLSNGSEFLTQLGSPRRDSNAESEPFSRSDVISGHSKTNNEGFPPGHLQQLGAHREPTEEVTVLDYVPNSVDFYEKFVRTRKPVLMRGAAKSMPAFTKWQSKDYLKENFGDTPLKVELKKIFDSSVFVKTVMNLSEFLDRYETEEIYMDTPAGHNRMLKDITVPMCMSCPELTKSFVSANLLFSNGGTSSSYHFDGVDNLLTLVSGRKRFIVVENEYLKHSYFDNYTLNSVISPINPEAVDMVKYPLMQDVRYGVVDMNAGDILYNPSLLPHHVRSFDSPNIALSIWFHPVQLSDPVELKDTDSTKDVVHYHTELHKHVKKNAPETLKCGSDARHLFSVLHKSPVKDLQFVPVDKKKSSLEPFMLNTGYTIPRMGFGTPRIRGPELQAVYTQAFKAGYRMVDSGQVYDEEALGAALEESGIARQDVFLISKVNPQNYGKGRTLDSIDESLRRLKVDHIDLMLLHAKECGGLPFCLEAGNWKDAWADMEVAVDKGKVRSIGVSNFESVAELEEVMKLSSKNLSVVQNYMDPFSVPTEVLDFCKEFGIVFMGFGTLGRAYVKDEGMKVNPVFANEYVKEQSESRQCTPAEYVLRWAMQMGTVVIPSSQNPTHMSLNLHAFDFVLVEEEMSSMGRLQMQDPISGRYKDLQASDPAGSGMASSQGTDGGAVMPELEGLVIDKFGEVNLNELAVFAGGDDGLFTAFNGSTGDIIWRYQTYNEFGSSCVFSSDQTHLYFSSENHRVYSIQVTSGESTWSVSTNGAFIATPQFDLAKSVLLLGNLKGHFFCIERVSGHIRWERELSQNEIWSTAAVGQVANREIVYVGVLETGVYALHVIDGLQLWHVKVKGGVWGSPTLSDNGELVFFGGLDGNMYCVDTASGETVWTWRTRGQLMSSPLLQGGVVFCASDEGALFALNAETGIKIWKIRVGAKLISSPRLLSATSIVIGATDGTVRAYRMSNGKRIWTFKTGDEVWSSAILSSTGVMFIGGLDEHMYALNATSGTPVWKTKSSLFAASPCISPKFKHNLSHVSAFGL